MTYPEPGSRKRTIEAEQGRRRRSRIATYMDVEEAWRFFAAVAEASIGRGLRALHSECRIIPGLPRWRVPACFAGTLDSRWCAPAMQYTSYASELCVTHTGVGPAAISAGWVPQQLQIPNTYGFSLQHRSCRNNYALVNRSSNCPVVGWIQCVPSACVTWIISSRLEAAPLPASHLWFSDSEKSSVIAPIATAELSLCNCAFLAMNGALTHQTSPSCRCHRPS